MTNALDVIRGTARDAVTLFTGGVTELRQGVSLFQSWQLNLPQMPRFRYQTYADVGYRKNTLVYACIREVATSVSEAPFRIVVDIDGVSVPVEDHPAMDLLQNPNPMMTGYEFWETELIIEQIAGNCYVWKERGNDGRPAALWILRPDWVRFTPKQPITNSFYEYAPGGQFDSGKTLPIPMNDMLHFKAGVDPLNIYGEGLSPLRVALTDTLLDNDATNFFRTVFTNSGIPSGLIKVKRRLQNQKEANRIKQQWMERYGGIKGWNTPAVMDEDAEYEKLGMDFREMMADAIRDVPETRICMSFGVPPILVGSNIGLKRSTYTNYNAAKGSFWDETLGPKFQSLALKVQTSLLNVDYPTDIVARAEFDLSNVRALREDKMAQWKRATAALNAGGLTQNMFLREIGHEPIGPEGDVFLIPPGRTTAPAEPKDPNAEVAPAQLPEGDSRHLRPYISRNGVPYHKLYNVSRRHELVAAGG